MSVMTIKHNGKFVPAKKVDGVWVPDESAELFQNGDVLEVRAKGAPPVKGGEQHGDEKKADEKGDEEGEKDEEVSV